MGGHGGSARRPAAVEAVRGHPALVGVFRVVRDSQRGRLRGAPDAAAGDPARLPHPPRRTAGAHARPRSGTAHALRPRPGPLGVHGRGVGLGRHRPARADRVRRRRTRRRPRTLPVRFPQDAGRRPRPRHLAAPAPHPSHRRPAGTASARTWSLRTNSQANATVRSLDEPAGTLFFGHRANECVWVAEPAHTTAADGDAPAPEAIRITAAEAGVLQTFPADYPWAGNKGQQFSQIGNAVPPRLAAHLLAPHLGRTLGPDDFTLAA